MNGDDRDLYERFAAVRRVEEAHLPRFSMLWKRAGRPLRWGVALRFSAAAVCLATLIAGAVWLLPVWREGSRGASQAREQEATSITTWKPATDFLLESPGSALLEGVPEVGSWHGMSPATRGGKRRRRTERQNSP